MDLSRVIYLVVGCPCALVVSTPVSVVTAIGNAAKSGVLIKGGIHLEDAGSLKVIAFDKTGTLTRGIPTVTDIVTFGGDENELLMITAALEKGSQHPLASAIMKKAEANELNYNELPVEDFQSITGKGIQATIKNERYYVGSPNMFEEILPYHMDQSITKQIMNLQTQGKTVMILGTDHAILCLIAVADQVRKTPKMLFKSFIN